MSITANTYDFRLQSPFAIVFSGASRSGKSTLAEEVIRNRDTYINGKITKVIYCYSYLSKGFAALKSEDPENIVLVDNFQEINNHLVEDCLLVLDDALTYLDNKSYLEQITDLFTKRIHHERLENSILLYGFEERYC